MQQKRTVFVSGIFNVLHPGHLRLLRFAKECGDRLVVAVEGDRKVGSGAHVHETLRLEGVQSNLWVDEAFITNDPITLVIERLKPDVVVKGKEHQYRINPEVDVLEGYGGRLLFSSGEASLSSLDLIRKEFREFNSHSIHVPEDFLDRHMINMLRIRELLNNFSKLKVCVIGDLIIDEYITCQPLGMSQEDPTIVVTPIDSTRFIGGAGIVAAHAVGLGAEVNLISVTGDDPMREFAVQSLKNMGVGLEFVTDDSRPTTLKQRYRSKGKSLLRISHLHQSAISENLQFLLVQKLEKALENADLLVFSDFNYGCLPQAVVDQAISMARSRNIVMAADSQSSSQIGDISRFKGMDLLTPTEREARISMRNHEDGLVVLAEQILQQAAASNVFLKLGEEGLLIHTHNGNENNWLVDRVDALNSAPKDVAGAGDSLLITAAMVLASAGNIWEAAYLGSIAAAVQVGRVGNTPIQISELIQEITGTHKQTFS